MPKPNSPTTEFVKLRNLLKAKDNHIMLLKDSLKNKEDEILILKAKLKLKKDSYKKDDLLTMKDSINKNIGPKEDHATELKKIIINQNRIINEFKGSILYPFYRLTQKIGRAKIGKKIALLLKGKK